MKKKILILEDKKSHREVLCKIIEELPENVQVYTAADVKSAWQIAMENTIHLFLTDIILCPENLGDVKGLHFAQEIRGVGRYQFTPLIFITSLQDPKLYTYSQLHCFGFIEKPFDPEVVKNLISQALKFPVVEDSDRYAYFKKDGIVYSKYIKDIIRIENVRRKTIIYCKNDILEIPYKTCDEIFAELDSKLFVRCSRYNIINKAYVERIDYVNRYVKLKHIDEQVEIGIKMRNKFREEMEQDSGRDAKFDNR